MSISTERQKIDGGRGVAGPPASRAPGAGYLATLALTVVLAAGCFLLAMSVLLLVVHPGTGFLATQVILQKQSAKTALYIAGFLVILPLAVVIVPRLADAIAAGPNGPGLPALVSGLVALLALALILVKILPVSHHGLRPLLAAVGVWSVVAVGSLARARRPRAWPALLFLARAGSVVPAVAVAGVLGTVLCVTALGQLSVAGLVVGAVVALVIILVWERISPGPAGRVAGGAFDVLVVVLLLAAVVNVVVYHASPAVPSTFVPPGLIQFQQDWILGPTNQLLHGGALLVNDPSSQYGVGMVYFLAGWFHLAPISYATFGLLDGILTGLVYVGGYLVLRMAGVSRLLSAAALALGLTCLIYHLTYPVGSLPELGPLRFGMPMGVILASVAAEAWPARDRAARALALVVVGIASIWAVEAFVYTLVAYLAMIVVQGLLRSAGARVRWFLTQCGLALAACLLAHLLLAAATLMGTGHLPDWSQYLAYVKSLLLGGREGLITYGFADWSPGLAVGLVLLASAAALVLLLVRAPGLARRRRKILVALSGVTAYAIASFSYIDNRSSTYLLLYVGLPALMAATLWLQLVLDSPEVPQLWQRAAVWLTLPIAAVMVAAAWPTVGSEFSQSALAHSYPSGGLSTALHRLWHPPPIDPRAPAATRLVRHYLTGDRVLILLPDASELALETQMRAGRGDSLYMGDPAEDVFIPGVWKPRISHQIASLPARSRVLIDRAALSAVSRLRGLPPDYALSHPRFGGSQEINWILHRLDQRFRIVPIHRGTGQFVVASLVPRARRG